MKIHIIAVGGRIMHTLALNLVEQSHVVTGSDDEIYEPSKSRLADAGVLPEEIGWNASRITSDIDLVILGMHAREDNPELVKAQEIGLKIVSYPEFIYDASISKKRVVIAGSHGKTSTTAMIMHVLKYRNLDYDYLIGAELEGFGKMVKLSDAPLIIIEGDEYLSSSIDRRPKMMHYQPHISVITGIAWDHINVFKTEEDYIALFDEYLDQHQSDASIYLYEEDKQLRLLGEKYGHTKNISYYKALALSSSNNVVHDQKQYRINVFGEHNRANMMAALDVCMDLGITAPDFFAAISTFRGAAKRLELLIENQHSKVYRDFAHAPSKVNATVTAIKEQYPHKRIIALLELHTYSSLNIKFLPKYKGALDNADEAYVYYSEHTLSIKKMDQLSPQIVEESFENPSVKAINQKEELELVLEQIDLDNCVILIMSSGTFDHLDVKGILEKKL